MRASMMITGSTSRLRLSLRARLGLALLLFAPFAGAHVPHDVVNRLAVSPAFAEDETLPDLRATSYAARGRSETATGVNPQCH